MKIKYRFLCLVLTIVVGVTGILPTFSNTVYAAADEDFDEDAGLIEKVCANFLVMGSLGMYTLLGTLSEDPLTIETLIFNKYGETRLSFFNNEISKDTNSGDPIYDVIYVKGSRNGKNMDVINPFIKNNKIISSINDVTHFFTQLAVIAYMMILVYMGIRILLSATAQRSAKYKELTLYWVQGLLILFFFPYVIKYTIKINDTFVQFIYDNKAITYGTEKFVENTPPKQSGGIDVDDMALTNAKDKLEKQGETLNNPNADYMSVVFKLATAKGFVVYAICWIVMVKQLMALLIVYFKRLLTVMYLIAIFPLVAISYAIDKIGDGKSQAFGNWYKEFALNVFLQSFHAIIYVLCMALIMLLGKTGKDIQNNWLLILILITFISKGDDMLRGIFNMKGGGADTVKSVGATMMQAKAATDMAKKASGFAHKHFGDESNLGKAKYYATGVYSNILDNSVARANINEANMELAAAQSTVVPEPVHEETPEMDASQVLEDAKNTLFNNPDATDEEKRAALQNILDIQNSGEHEEEFNAFIAGLDSEEQAQELTELLQTMAAVNAIAGNVEVNLRQNLEILLQQMKKGGLHAAIAKGVNRTPKELASLRALADVKFKKPESGANAGQKERRGSTLGNRYRAGTAALAGATDRTGKLRYTGKFTEAHKNLQNANNKKLNGRFKFNRVVKKAGRKEKAEIKKLENVALGEQRRLNQLQQRAKMVKKTQGVNSKEYKDLTDRIEKLSQSKHLKALREKRREYAEKGIFFKGVGKTQQFLNKTEARNKRSDKREDIRKTFRENRNAVGKAKNAIILRNQGKIKEAEELEQEILKGKTVGSVIWQRPDGKGKVRMTKAQRIINKRQEKDAIDKARKAVKLRREALSSKRGVDQNKLDMAIKLEKEIAAGRRTSLRGYDPNSQNRRKTKAQKILERENQKYSLQRVREHRKAYNAFRAKLKEEESKYSTHLVEYEEHLRKYNDVINSAEYAGMTRKQKEAIENEHRGWQDRHSSYESRHKKYLHDDKKYRQREATYLRASNEVRETLRQNGVAISLINRGDNFAKGQEFKLKHKGEFVRSVKSEYASIRTLISTRRDGGRGALVDGGEAARQRKQQAYRLKSEGVILTAPNISGMLQRAINGGDSFVQERVDAHEAKQTWKIANKDAKVRLAQAEKKRKTTVKVESVGASVRVSEAIHDLSGFNLAGAVTNLREARAISVAARKKAKIEKAKDIIGVTTELYDARREFEGSGAIVKMPALTLHKAQSAIQEGLAVIQREDRRAGRRESALEVVTDGKAQRDAIRTKGRHDVATDGAFSAIRRLAERKEEQVIPAGRKVSKVAEVIGTIQEERRTHEEDRAILKNAVMATGGSTVSESFLDRIVDKADSIGVGARNIPNRVSNAVRNVGARIEYGAAEVYAGTSSAIRGAGDGVASLFTRDRSGSHVLRTENENAAWASVIEQYRGTGEYQKSTDDKKKILGFILPNGGESTSSDTSGSGGFNGTGGTSGSGFGGTGSGGFNGTGNTSGSGFGGTGSGGSNGTGNTSGSGFGGTGSGGFNGTGDAGRSDSGESDSNGTGSTIPHKNIFDISDSEYANAMMYLSSTQAEIAKRPPEEQVNIDRELSILSNAIAAINGSNEGIHTASQMLGHVGTVRDIMNMFPRDSKEYKELEIMYRNLRYDIDNYESNLRIQVLNDTTLIARDDPNRRGIIDSSIKYVQGMKQDDYMLDLLEHSPRDLQVGFDPISRVGLRQEASISNWTTQQTDNRLQSALGNELKQKRIIEQNEARIAANNQKIAEGTAKFATSAIGAAVDLTIGIPGSIALGMTAGSMGASGSKSSEYIVSAGTSALAVASVAGDTYSKTSKWAGEKIGRATNNVRARLAKAGGVSATSSTSVNTVANTRSARAINTEVIGKTVIDRWKEMKKS